MTKVEAISALLKEKGDAASWAYIYGNLERYYPDIKASKDWKAGIRGVLYRELYANRTFKRVDVGLYALRDLEDESVEGVVPAWVDIQALLKRANKYQSTQSSHRIKTGPHKVRNENRSQKNTIALIEGYSCQVCNWTAEWTDPSGKKRKRIDVDHILPKGDEGDENVLNLWALCPNCHLKKTLGIITIDVTAKEVRENGHLITLNHDDHLGIGPSRYKDLKE